MKLILKFLSIVLVLLSVPGFSQVQSQFQGTINIFASSATPTPYRYSLTGFFNDSNGQYASEDLEIGDIIYASEGFSCVRFTIDSIISEAGSIISAYITDYDSVSTVPPSGIAALLRESPNNQYPTYIAGINESLQSCILSHFMLKVDMGSSGILNITQLNHGFSKWQPVYWNSDSTRFEIPSQDSLIANYVVIDSIDANTFAVATSGTFATDLADGYYYQFDGSYSTTSDTITTPLFAVADGYLTINPLRGYDFSDYANTWLKTELEAGTPVSIAADTVPFDITGLERARFIANRIGDYTYSSRMYNTNTPNAGMYVTNSRNGTVNRIEIDTLKTRLVAYSTTAETELAFYQDSLTLKMTSDTPQVGQVLAVSSIAGDGITANLKFEDDASQNIYNSDGELPNNTSRYFKMNADPNDINANDFFIGYYDPYVWSGRDRFYYNPKDFGFFISPYYNGAVGMIANSATPGTNSFTSFITSSPGGTSSYEDAVDSIAGTRASIQSSERATTNGTYLTTKSYSISTISGKPKLPLRFNSSTNFTVSLSPPNITDIKQIIGYDSLGVSKFFHNNQFYYYTNNHSFNEAKSLRKNSLIVYRDTLYNNGVYPGRVLIKDYTLYNDVNNNQYLRETWGMTDSLNMYNTFAVKEGGTERPVLKMGPFIASRTLDTLDAIELYGKYKLPNETPAIASGKKSVMTWTGTGTAATPAFDTAFAAALSRDLNTTPLVPSNTAYAIPFQFSNITDPNYTVTGDTAFTVGSTGVYEITFAGGFTMASGAALQIGYSIDKNGSGIGFTKAVYVNTTSSPTVCTKIVSCTAGDEIKVKIAVVDLSGRSLNVDAGSNLTIKKLK